MSRAFAPAGLLEGKVALITGAGRGIGKVIAEMFVAEGAKVLVSDFSGEQHDTAAALGSAAVACHADVTREDDIEAMFGRALEAFGRVDASIHVAGNPGGRWGDEVTVEEFDAYATIHLRGMMLCCKHAVRAMLPPGGGAIVNFSSAASMNYDPYISFAYSAAKAGINSLTKSFAGRYGKQGIRCNAIAPGFTLSEKNMNIPEAAAETLRNKASLGRAGTPAEQAAVAVFLASDRASFLTGVTIPVDGGWTARLA
jgi:NAD(P)-dependent dehydrogenase (short-subunit alcohol dehydrogenase family)